MQHAPCDSMVECFPVKTRFRLLRGIFFLLASFAVLAVAVSVTGPVLSPLLGKEEEADAPLLFRHIDRKLEQSYLDLDRIRPRELIQRALSALELAGDEIYVDNADADNPYVALYVHDNARVFPLNELKTRTDSVRLLENVFEFLARHYDGDATLNDLRYAAANGYLSGIDPHTLVFTPKAFEDFEQHISGEIFGVGMLVGNTRDGRLEVRQVINGTPAHAAGFRKGDLIVKIDDESAISMTVTEAVQKIRGPRGTEVTLTVRRRSGKDADTSETLPIAVKRDKVIIKSVESKLLKSVKLAPDAAEPVGVGYVKVTNFDQQTYRSLRVNLSRLESENNGKALGALILDLRDNSGGLLQQAIQMTDAFLSKGEIVLTAQKDDITVKVAEDENNEPDYPIVVLADQASASGAEIVIGALQKNNRAIVLGTNTFGKGSVQQLHELPNGAQLKITVSEYLLPGKTSIQENGVTPDVFAEAVVLAPDGFNLFADENVVSEKQYDTHIVSKYARKEEPSYRLKYLLEDPVTEVSDETASSQERFISGDIEPEKDALVRMALRILEHSSKPFDPRQILKEKKAAFAALEEEFFTAIVKRLAELGVDWSKPTTLADALPDAAPPALQLEVSSQVIEEPSTEKDDPLPVQKLLLTARAVNRGAADLYRVKALVRSDYYLFDDQEILFGKIAAGALLERQVKVRLPYYPQKQNTLLNIEASADDEKVLASVAVEIVLDGKERPVFAYKASLRDEKGELLERLPVDGSVRLAVTVENVGKGSSQKGVAILRNKTGREIFLDKGRIEFANVGPGERTDIEFSFTKRPGREMETAELELVIFDPYSGETLSRKLDLPIAGSRREPFPNNVSYAPPAIEVALSEGEVGDSVTVSEKAEIRLRSRVTGAKSKFKAWVTCLPLSQKHRTPDKIFFASSSGTDALRIDTPVKLSPGINIITVVAKDENGSESRRGAVVRRKDKTPPATVRGP